MKPQASRNAGLVRRLLCADSHHQWRPGLLIYQRYRSPFDLCVIFIGDEFILRQRGEFGNCSAATLTDFQNGPFEWMTPCIAARPD